MPFKNHEEKLAYHRKYYGKHREKIKAQDKISYQKNKEKYKQKAREYWRNHKDEISKKHKIWLKSENGKLKIRNWRKNFKINILIHYGGNPPKCACCGETEIDFLTIDHINNGGTKDRKSVGCGSTFYYWLKRNNFPEGYQVLCFNCNCGRRINDGICPHLRLVMSVE